MLHSILIIAMLSTFDFFFGKQYENIPEIGPTSLSGFLEDIKTKISDDDYAVLTTLTDPNDLMDRLDECKDKLTDGEYLNISNELMKSYKSKPRLQPLTSPMFLEPQRETSGLMRIILSTTRPIVEESVFVQPVLEIVRLEDIVDEWDEWEERKKEREEEEREKFLREIKAEMKAKNPSRRRKYDNMPKNIRNRR
jgi:hypothetical protein